VIVVDSSALMAIVLRESEASRCRDALLRVEGVSISAATLAETLIVALGKNVRQEIEDWMGVLDIQVEPVTEPLALAAAEAFRVWGKGRHPAGLNYGDCFSYALAKSLNRPLLYVGADFSLTDVKGA
jgi:ribonuclease VapC